MLTEAHDVVTALGGRDALLVLQKEVNFDAILCDLQMPEMSGMELYLKVKARYPDLAGRFIFVTGGAFSTEARRFLEQGVPCIGKPFRSDELMAVLDAKIAERKALEHVGVGASPKVANELGTAGRGGSSSADSSLSASVAEDGGGGQPARESV